MKKCRLILLSMILLLMGVAGIVNIRSTDVHAESNYHHVTFDYNASQILEYIPENESIIESLKSYVTSVAYGELVSERLPSSLISPYYNYHWTVNGVAVNLDNYRITRDVTLKAVWTPVRYSVQYRFENEEIKNAVTNLQPGFTFTVESERIDLYRPIVPNYYFLGWFDGNDPLEHWYLPAKSITDKVFTAKFKPIDYSINFNTDATIYNVTRYNVENENITLNAPSKEGHIFKGWYSDKGFNNKVTEINCSIGGNLNLYPKWELEKYKVTYILPDGKVEVVETEYGKKAELPKNFKKSIFQVIKTDVSRKDITSDTIIRISTVSIWYVYVLGLMVIGGIIALIICIKKKRDNAHNKLRQFYHSNSSRKY